MGHSRPTLHGGHALSAHYEVDRRVLFLQRRDALIDIRERETVALLKAVSSGRASFCGFFHFIHDNGTALLRAAHDGDRGARFCKSDGETATNTRRAADDNGSLASQ